VLTQLLGTQRVWCLCMMKNTGGNGSKVGFASRLAQLCRSKGGTKNLTKSQKHALSVAKVCMKRNRDKGAVLRALQVLLSARQHKEHKDFGAEHRVPST